ncbi:MAG TPA: hypothetical protein VGK92_15440 [Gaiellales bacterium]
MPESLAHALQRRAFGARGAGARAPAAPRRARSVARTLERLAAAAEDGARRPRRLRPPRSVLEVAPEAPGIRELAALLRQHAQPPHAVVAACDRFVDGCWNGVLRNLDREYHRRELGRLRYLLLC